MGELLIDSIPLTMTLEESGKGSGRFIFRGQFARSDKATENRRLYREHLWRREIGRLSESMSGRSMFGELDHPQDGRTKLSRVSHLVTGLSIKGTEVIGEAEVLDTPNGRILKAIAESGGKVGVSSRGYGSTKTLPDGTLEVQEDFRLDTFDFVADPATKGAYPDLFREHREHIPSDDVLTAQDLHEHYHGLVELHRERYGDAPSSRALVEAEERTERRLKDQFAVELRRATEVIREEAEAAVRSDLMSDPEVAGARQVVEQIVGMVKSYGIDPEAREEMMGRDKQIEELQRKLGDRELEIQKAQREASEFKALAREAALTLHLERALRDDPAREAIQAIVGKVTEYSDTDDLDRKIKAVREELDRRGGVQKPKHEASEERIAELESELEAAKSQIAKVEDGMKRASDRADRMQESARKALAAAEDMERKLHLESKLHGLAPKDRESIRRLCEDKKSIEEIDDAIEGWDPPAPSYDRDEAERISARVGRGKAQNLNENEPSRANGKERMLTEVGGPDLGGFNRLAGTGRQA